MGCSDAATPEQQRVRGPLDCFAIARPEGRASFNALWLAMKVIPQSLLPAGLDLLHVGVDRIHDFGVRIGFTIDDDLVDALFCASDIDGMPLHMAVPPAA